MAPPSIPRTPPQAGGKKRSKDEDEGETDEGHDSKRRDYGLRAVDKPDATESVVEEVETSSPSTAGDSLSTGREPGSWPDNYEPGSESEPGSEAQTPSPSKPTPDWGEVADVFESLPTLSPEKYEKAALWLLNALVDNDIPKGSNIPPPPWYRGRCKAFRVDDETGLVRPRRMVDDFLDARKRRKRSPTPDSLTKEENSTSPEPSIKRESP